MEAIQRAISTGELPTEKESLLGSLLQSDGTYVHQEGAYWDFKREWPFSYSDGYFGAIARLICAFSNSHGGLIIFGVHDETRTAGHNKVATDLDKLQLALSQTLTEAPKLVLRQYDGGKPTSVDVLLVLPNDLMALPIRFKKQIGQFKAGSIWVRQSHEVIEAEPRHIPLLYCRSLDKGDGAESPAIDGGLPPSPATIKRFVGRIATIDNIFRWLKLSDEPRTFLYGKGGSGKTTIAYEVAKAVRDEGADIRIFGNEKLDTVIFISAKQTTLNVINQTADDFVGRDFSNERELYEAILTLANWTSEPMSGLDLSALRENMKELFDVTSNFIVIDDIDTLTTSGTEAGFDFLYRTLSRSKRQSKLLYTIRNAPTQSLANSIEVPGLIHGEYEEFVNVCANQFNVPVPDDAFLGGPLAQISERRPLVVESIIALRRGAGTYQKAMELFEQESGEDVRSYVFKREWNSLTSGNYGRYVLAVLALYNAPMAFDDIAVLTQYEATRVKDALADVREMFLQLNEIGPETTFQLGSLTQAFVLEQSKKLDHYPVLKERVEKYKRKFFPENPILSRLRDRVERLVSKGYRFGDEQPLQEALQILSDRTLPPKISEDPRFTALRAYVSACQKNPNMEDVRRLFKIATEMGLEPDLDHLKRWYYAERDLQHGLDQCIKIADLVCEGKQYSDEDRVSVA